MGAFFVPKIRGHILVQPKNRRIATEAYADTAKAEAIADAQEAVEAITNQVIAIDAPSGFDANSVTSQAVHMVNSLDDALNMPGDGSWLLWTYPQQGSTALQQLALKYSATGPELHVRVKTSVGWSAWNRIDADKWELLMGAVKERLPETADLPELLITFTDNDGKETWLSARTSDGGPTDWAMHHLTERLGVLTNQDTEYLFSVVDEQERMTDLAVRASDGQIPDWIMDRWEARLSARMGVRNDQDTEYLFGVVDEQERITDLAVRASDGQIPDWVMDRWRERLGISQSVDTQGAGVSSPMVPILQSIAAGVERHVAGDPIQPAVVNFNTGTALDQPAKIFFPDRYNDVRPMPLVISFMGIGSTVGSHWTYTDLRPKLVEAGALMGGGAYGGDLYGAPQMLDSVRDLYEKALRIAPVSGVVLFGNSMGGIGALNALTTGAIPNVLGVYLTDPTFDLRQRYDSNASRETTIREAYGIAADGSDYDQKTAGYDPALRPAADFQGVPIRIYSSTGDTLWADHTVKLVEKLSATNDVDVHNTGSEGHNNTDRFNGTDLAAFVTKCVDGPTGLRL